MQCTSRNLGFAFDRVKVFWMCILIKESRATLSLTLCLSFVCRMSLFTFGHIKAHMINTFSSHKQIISRYIASTDLASVTAPGHQVWLCPLPAWDVTGPPLSSLASHCLQATGPGRTCHFGSMDTPAHPPVHNFIIWREMRDKKREGRTHPGHLMTWFWMNGWVWIALDRDMAEVDRPERGLCGYRSVAVIMSRTAFVCVCSTLSW